MTAANPGGIATVRVPFPGAPWNKRVRELGLMPDNQQYRARDFYQYAGGKAKPGKLSLLHGSYNVPIINAADPAWEPNTKVAIFHATAPRDNGSGRFEGIKVGQVIPWNFKWMESPGGDGTITLENYPLNGPDGRLVTLEIWMAYEPLINGWDYWGKNNMSGFNNYYPQDFWQMAAANPLDPSNRKIVVGAALVNPTDTWEPGWRTMNGCGCGIDRRAMQTTAAEVASGTIGHAFSLSVPNTHFAKLPGVKNVDWYSDSATRVEFSPTQAKTRASYDPDPAHNFQHGMCIALDMTSAEIGSYLGRRGYTGNTATSLRTMIENMTVQYGCGMRVKVTGGHGIGIEMTGDNSPDGPWWSKLGIKPGVDYFDGLMTPENVRFVRSY